ncbi:unnamed protein product [Fraxinus pennsylvanica]|uniref:Uncharacterized protein n=1 Tax=Fraxinus pennsylvanica TaxID=56036 RepID=A0AAD2A9F6_9LAMI|nr:unnamed protein product [Fraxinus pennsylvanica]
MKRSTFPCIVYSNFVILFLLLSATSIAKDFTEEEGDVDIKRSDFPDGFLFGASTSSYQIEGAYLEDGKGLSNWDVFCRIEGIEPFVTIHHFDYPQELEDRYGSWLSTLMQDDFVHFAETCFNNFGDHVKYWSSINVPNLFGILGFEIGTFPPARCSSPFGNCRHGNSDIKPLFAVHNMLLAHAKAAKLYRTKFKANIDYHLAYEKLRIALRNLHRCSINKEV